MRGHSSIWKLLRSLGTSRAHGLLPGLLPALFVVVWLWPGIVAAQAGIDFSVSGDDEALTGDLRSASLLLRQIAENPEDSRAVVGAALADYGTFVGVLYQHGYFGGAVTIRVNGQEAAELSLLAVPDPVRSVEVRVRTGPLFRFSEVSIRPAPPLSPVGWQESLPQAGAPARGEAVRDAVQATISGWREAGYARASLSDQRVVADHAQKTLSVTARIAPGPRTLFGTLKVDGESTVRARQIQRIAGFPTGEVFSPDALGHVAGRLQRTGAFASVALREAAALNPDGTLDVTAALVDAKPRRYGFGAELSTNEGLGLSGFWMHRNAFGDAERLRFEGRADNIGGQTSGADYGLSARLDRPAAFGPDTSIFLLAEAERLNEPDYQSDRIGLGIGARRIFSDRLQVEQGVTLNYAETRDDFGDREFTFVSLPGVATWDGRDDPLNPASGAYLQAEVTPFLGLDQTASGVRAAVDLRGYKGVLDEDRLVLAGRLQIGTVLGSALEETHPDFLFFSGGSGTVRGQPYQSLNIQTDGGIETGGRSFVGLSTEMRAALWDKFSAVAFWDVGYVGPESVWDSAGVSHSGAGLGARYQTPLGPLRFDMGVPLSGTTRDGMQLYIGIGQAF